MTSEVDWNLAWPVLMKKPVQEKIVAALARENGSLKILQLSELIGEKSPTVNSAVRPERELRKTGLIEKTTKGFALTPKGEQYFFENQKVAFEQQKREIELIEIRNKKKVKAGEIIELCRVFLEKDPYHDQLLNARSKGQTHLEVDFVKLAEASPDLADYLFEDAESLFAAFGEACRDLDLTEENASIEPFKIRIKNLPNSDKIDISEIRSRHLEKFFCVVGDVVKRTDPKPAVTNVRFECPSCGNIIPVLQLDQEKFLEPSRCSCGRKGKFKELSKDIIDVQTLVLQEPLELTPGAKPRELFVMLTNDLCSVRSEMVTAPGSRIKVNGCLKEVPQFLRSGKRSIHYDVVLHANNVEPVESSYSELQWTAEEEIRFKELAARDDLIRYFKSVIFPSLHGLETIKEVAILQQFQGCAAEIREDFHVLIVGDPGLGKSEILKRVSCISPKSRYVQCENATKAGLSGTVEKDELTGKWEVTGGPITQANQGTLFADELDKLLEHHLAALHEPMESQTVTISKAGVYFKAKAKTAFLAAANPVGGRFDSYKKPFAQIELPNSLWSRFDFTYCVSDKVNYERDFSVAEAVLGKFKKAVSTFLGKKDSLEFLRKYIAFAKQKCQPELPKECHDEIRDYWVRMRPKLSGKSIPWGVRQLAAIARLAQARARMRLSSKVDLGDVAYAKQAMKFSLESMTTEDYGD